MEEKLYSVLVSPTLFGRSNPLLLVNAYCALIVEKQQLDYCKVTQFTPYDGKFLQVTMYDSLEKFAGILEMPDVISVTEDSLDYSDWYKKAVGDYHELLDDFEAINSGDRSANEELPVLAKEFEVIMNGILTISVNAMKDNGGADVE